MAGYFRRRAALAGLAFMPALAVLPLATAQFIPDRMYIAGMPYAGHPGPDDYDVVIEYNPADGAWREFARLPPGSANGSRGVIFTPDGSRLRVANRHTASIYEIDPQGGVERVLGGQDGIFVGQAMDNLAYGPNGDFYISQGNILRFPASGGPGEVFADYPNGLTGYGPIDTAPDGSLYYGRRLNGNASILRFTDEGIGELFDELPSGSIEIGAMAVDSAGNTFALSGSGIYRYDAGDSGTRRRLSTLTGSHISSVLELSPDESELFFLNNNLIYRIDTLTGETVLLPIVAPWPSGSWSTCGMAYYVPEPNSLVLIGVAGFGLRRRRTYARFEVHFFPTSMRRSRHENEFD